MMSFNGPGFKMQVPTDWVVTSTPQIQAMFVSPSSTKGRANFMVTLRPVEEGVTLDQVAKASLETQKKEYRQFSLEKDVPYKKGTVTGWQRLYAWFSKEHNVKILQRQIIILNNRLLFTLIATRPDVDEMKKMDPILKDMIDSFQLE